jgi:hypothetical protein
VQKAEIILQLDYADKLGQWVVSHVSLLSPLQSAGRGTSYYSTVRIPLYPLPNAGSKAMRKTILYMTNA